MSSILSVQNLSHIFSDNTPFRKVAVDKINLELNEGEILGIIGHTGSGKTTLVSHLNGLLKPTSGQILFKGTDLFSKKEFTREVRFKVGLVFQYPEYQLFEETVEKDIAFGPKNMGLSEAEVKERITFSLSVVGLDDEILAKSPFELSGGQKRRVALAGVIAMRPEVLILDEPTAGLDPKGRDEILSHIKEYNEKTGASVVFVTHSMEDIASVCNRIIVMKKGSVRMCGTPLEIFSKPDDIRALGLDIPQITELCFLLRAGGMEIPEPFLTVDQAVAYLRKEAGIC